MSINNVTLVGRLTKDPELKYTPNGIAVANFTLAINRPFKNANGDNEADFINCVTWRKQAENAANFLKKGSLAGVTGSIQVRTYEKDGNRQYFTEVVADSVQFLEPKGAGGANKPQQQKPASQTRVDTDPFSGNGQIDIDDSDLPF